MALAGDLSDLVGPTQAPARQGRELTRQTRELAPAKLNLCLRLLGRRPDGLHELWSLAQPITLADEVEVRLGPVVTRDAVTEAPDELIREGSCEVTCACPGHPALDGPRNLAAQAASRLLLALGVQGRCEVKVNKRIPIGAGLGGGSADAAATLRALGRLLGPVAPLALLETIAASLGADVPFCLRSEAALMEGAGERLRPVRLPMHWLCLVHPGVTLSTQVVFARHDALGAQGGAAAPRASHAAALAPALPRGLESLATLEDLAALVSNDLFPAAASLAPGLLEALDALRRNAPIAAGMTGSGSYLFGLFAEETGARAARASLVTEGFLALLAAPLGQGTPLGPPPGSDDVGDLRR